MSNPETFHGLVLEKSPQSASRIQATGKDLGFPMTVTRNVEDVVRLMGQGEYTLFIIESKAPLVT